MMLLAEADGIDELWRLETHWRWSPAFTVLFVVGTIALVAWCYRRELSPAGSGYRALLAGLRLVTIGLILAMLSEALLSGTRSGRPRLSIAVDRSASMRVVDSFRPEELPADLRASDSPRDRLSLASEIIQRNSGALLEKLQATYACDLALVDQAVQSSPLTIPAELAKTLTTAAKPQPSNRETKLGDALSQILTDSSGGAPQAVLVLTDGQVTAGQSLATAGEQARRMGAPLYFVGIGRDEAPPGLELGDLLADDAVFVSDLAQVQAQLKSRGLAGERVKVSLRRKGGDTLAEQTLEVPAEGSAPLPVRLSFRPGEEGTYSLELVAEVARPQAAGKLVARLQHTLTVHDSKLKVLVAAGYPSYEFRYLKSLLERDSSIELSVYLQEADFEYVQADSAALPRFPVRSSELNEYDVLVLMDLDPTLLPRALWADVRKFVSQRGGGVALVSGPRYLPWSYSELADFGAICPLKLSGASVAGSLFDPGFQVQPTELGLQTPALQMADTPADSVGVWRELPPQYWYADAGAVKPGAQVLAAHPTATTSRGAPLPLIVQQYVGAGRVLLHAMDATYRWRYRVGDVYFARYWIQSLRMLARGKLRAGKSGVELVSDRRQYEAGEAVRIDVRIRDPQLAPAGERPLSALLEAAGQPQRTVELTPHGGEAGAYRAQLADLAPGSYRVLLAESLGAEAPPAINFEISPPAGELAALGMNRAAMTAAAQESRGAFVTLAEVDRLDDLIPAGRRRPLESLPPVELWNRWPFLAGILTCLVAEWVLRKRKAML